MQQIPRLILASRSPRRAQLLTEAGYQFQVAPPESTNEAAQQPGENTSDYVRRLALQKAHDAVAQVDQGCIIACDTLVECLGQVLGQPSDEADARRMLERLSGQLHTVYSGLCVWCVPQGQPRVEVAQTTLRMRKLSQTEIESYLAGGQWQGKAGAFGYQDRLGWLEILSGSESNVVGLPMELLANVLKSLAA